MSVKKPSESEEEFFARQEAEKRRRLAVTKSRMMAVVDKTALKDLHFMHCPKCGFDLSSVTFRGVQIDRCDHCDGTWLDAGELETLAGKEAGFLQTVISVFKGGK